MSNLTPETPDCIICGEPTNLKFWDAEVCDYQTFCSVDCAQDHEDRLGDAYSIFSGWLRDQPLNGGKFK